MKYGMSLPNFGTFGDVHLLIDLACKAEAAGWDGFFLWDHLLFCELDKNAHADPWITLSAIATQTETVMIGTLVTPIPRRRPWKLARETVTLQNLSKGRLILGVGLGAPEEWEYRFFHEEDDPKIRAKKLDEGLTILSNLWKGEPFGFKGEHFHLEEMTFLPVPVKPIPIWVGGYWPNKRPFRRAARYNGTYPGLLDGAMTPEALKEIAAYIRQQHGGNPAQFDLVAGGTSEANAQSYHTYVEPFEQIGATWWIEDMSPLRLGMGWEDLWKPWDVAPIEERILAGPPRS